MHAHLLRIETINRRATPTEKTFALALKQGVLRPRDLEAHGFPRHQIAILHRAGKLIRVGRGLYMHPDSGPTDNDAFALVTKRTPDALAEFFETKRPSVH